MESRASLYYFDLRLSGKYFWRRGLKAFPNAVNSMSSEEQLSPEYSRSRKGELALAVCQGRTSVLPKAVFLGCETFSVTNVDEGAKALNL